MGGGASFRNGPRTDTESIMQPSAVFPANENPKGVECLLMRADVGTNSIEHRNEDNVTPSASLTSNLCPAPAPLVDVVQFSKSKSQSTNEIEILRVGGDVNDLKKNGDAKPPKSEKQSQQFPEILENKKEIYHVYIFFSNAIKAWIILLMAHFTKL